jgi:hypothetical protein
MISPMFASEETSETVSLAGRRVFGQSGLGALVPCLQPLGLTASEEPAGLREELTLFFFDVLEDDLDELREPRLPGAIVVGKRAELVDELFELFCLSIVAQAG